MTWFSASQCILLVFLSILESGNVTQVQSSSEDPQGPDLVFLVGINRTEETPGFIYLVKAAVPQDPFSLPGPPRFTRGMVAEDPADDEEVPSTKPPRVTLIDLMLASMRKPKDNTPLMALTPPMNGPPLPMNRPPPPMNGPPPSLDAPIGENEEGEPEMPTNDDAEKEHVPNLFTDLAAFLMQPLRIAKKPGMDKPMTHTDRDGRYEIGMVGTMPYRRCPPGLRPDFMGNCRPMFRTRRGYNLKMIRIRGIPKQQQQHQQQMGHAAQE